MRGPAALCLVTAPPVPGKRRPYPDELDIDGRSIVYHYRSGALDQPDNKSLRAACTEQVPLIYFHGMAPGLYLIVAPVFIVADDPAARTVLLQVGLPVKDTTPEGPVSAPDRRAYALRDVVIRLHQARFRLDVLRAYRGRCTVCALRESALVQAAHIIRDPEPQGIAAVVNGLALCAIHHLAYDRNLLGIDPDAVIHISQRLLNESDGPMLREGLQGFHAKSIELPRRPEDRPDPERLARRYAEFSGAAA